MSTLEEICSAALPVDPLPPRRRERDAAIAHAPLRNHQLNADEQKVTHYKNCSKTALKLL